MDLPSNAIREFKDIFESEFLGPLSVDEARERAEAFMRVVILILQPVKRNYAIKSMPPEVDGGPGFDRLRGDPPEISIFQS